MQRRLLEQRQRALRKTRDTADERLRAAENALCKRRSLSRWPRKQLRSEVDLQQRAIRELDGRLSEVATAIEEMRAGRPPKRTLDRSNDRSPSTRRELSLGIER
jgi:hypothetical protein